MDFKKLRNLDSGKTQALASKEKANTQPPSDDE